MNPLSTDAQSVVDAARAAEVPSAEDRQRVKTKLFCAVAAGGALAAAEMASGVGAKSALAATTVKGVGAMSTGGAGAAVSTGGAAIAWGGTIKVLAAVSIAAATTTAVVKTDVLNEPAISVAVRKTSPDPSSERPVVVLPADSIPPSRLPDVTPAPITDSELPTIRPKKKNTVARVPKPTASASPRDEMTLMQEAVAAEEHGDFRGALSKVEQHRRRFPQSQLAEERLAVQITVLCRLGRQDKAKAMQSTFLERHPTSYLISRIEGACGP